MVEALGIAIPPLLDDPLPSSGFARWEPWPPQAAKYRFMERFRELADASRSRLSPSRTPGLRRAATPASPCRFRQLRSIFNNIDCRRNSEWRLARKVEMTLGAAAQPEGGRPRSWSGLRSGRPPGSGSRLVTEPLSGRSTGLEHVPLGLPLPTRRLLRVALGPLRLARCDVGQHLAELSTAVRIRAYSAAGSILAERSGLSR